jgi:hypothetical protein
MKKVYTLCLLAINSLSFAQWNISPVINNTVCMQPYEQVNSKIISDLKGGAIIVWEDYRNDPTQTKGDIYAQRVDAMGNTMWQTNGVVICTDTSNQTAPTAVSDSLGGAYIVWQDHRTPKRNLFAQHIDSLGNVSWAANGIGVALRNFDQKNPKLLNDRNNGTVIFWQDSVGGAYDIYGQRINLSGTAMWSSGIGVCTVPLSQVNPKAQITTAGDIYVTWQDKRNGSDYDIYMQKLNLSGAAQWPAGGINFCNIAGNQANPKVTLDANQLPVLIWQDKRNGFDYDIYVQRINASGVAQWAANGLAICTKTGTQNSADLLATGIANGTIFTWKDARSGTSTDIYAQMVNSTGVVKWAAGGIVITNAAFNQASPNVTSDGLGGALISYQDSSGGTWDIKAQRVNTAGTLLWAAGGANIGIAAGDQTNQSSILSSGGTSIYCFQDTRSGNNDMYVYKLDTTGHVYVAALVGIKKNAETKVIRVFPNPSNNKVQFEFTNQNENYSIYISDVNGNVLVSEDINNATSYVFSNAPSAGIYFYHITNKTNTINGKFIIIN